MVVLDTESYGVCDVFICFYYMATRLDDSIHVVSDIFSQILFFLMQTL